MSNIDDFKNQTKKVTEDFKKEISGVRTNRPSTLLVENIEVIYYNQKLPLKQVGLVSILPPRTIQIQVWDKEAVTAVLKAIEASSLNLSSNVDGNYIRINLPELSSERREELSKHVKKISEEYRIKLRHERDEANKKIQKMLDSKEIIEDQKFKLREEIQILVDKTNAEIEKTLEAKIEEIKS